VVRRPSGRNRGSELRSVAVLQLLLPGLGREAEGVAGGMAVDADQDVGEVDEWIDAVEPAAGEDGVQDAGALGAGLAAGEEPVLAADSDAPELALGGVVVETQASVVEDRVSGPH